MPKHKYSHARMKSRSSISDIEKRSAVALVVVILLMFAVTPLIVIYKKRGGQTIACNTTITNASTTNQTSGQTTTETINSVLSSSNSDILTAPTISSAPSLRPYVNSFGKNISSYVGDKIESTVNNSFNDLANIKLHL